MDWKTMRLDREAIFQEPRETVLEAARSFVEKSLVGWQITDMPDGFEAKGRLGSHEARAKFRIEITSFGTKMTITLLVERASALGFMLMDIGGYYNGQIRKWLEGIRWQIHEGLAPATQQPPPPTDQERPAVPKALAGAGNCLMGCVLALIFFSFILFIICTVIGLITGDLYIFGRGKTTVVHGPWARIISGFILMIFAFLMFRSSKGRK